jgi:Family of unknown function (DUF5681)
MTVIEAEKGRIDVTGATKKQLGGATGRGFVPGRSGNPRGRPRTAFISKLIPPGVIAAIINEMIEIATGRRRASWRERQACRKLLLNYGLGLPVQRVEVDGPPRVGSIQIIHVNKQLPERVPVLSEPPRDAIEAGSTWNPLDGDPGGSGHEING